ncbi:N-acetylmuramoyl-L-alanine amidase family protein [Chryseobacterium populi]|uniref:N-acetylmuramoyl-L-alanine amidase n=1 Tax=Chryseobacterium populi TaxID=1144316 RepID=J3CMR9_9FLAO|nr:N-acetylmuramoyl-L-alanine amidase [Chryseobacterium populi]EJL74824.1 N-acetylmuramoyl-L-alanine amidase [Chryseobacterium populi]
MKGIKLLALSLFSTAFLSFTPISKKYIIIDAGHGGNDLGANHSGIYEKNITLNIAKEIQKLNEKQEKYEIVLTRTSDAFPTLTDRTNQINKLNPELVISLHMNSNPEKETAKEGQEIYVQNTDGSRNLAEKISKKFGSCEIKERNLHILRESKSPAVVMELGFINNKKDREYVSSEKGQKEIAQKFVEVINEYP